MDKAELEALHVRLLKLKLELEKKLDAVVKKLREVDRQIMSNS